MLMGRCTLEVFVCRVVCWEGAKGQQCGKG